MLTVERLTKRFAGGKGIEDVSFQVEKGEVFGFLGPNGAGKSTTIRHILGFMKPDAGRVTVQGMDSWQHQGQLQRVLGYLPGEIAFPEGMNGKAFLDFMAELQGCGNMARRGELIDRLQFDARTPIRKMSKGMKQKVGIVAAFMHAPPLIILDEPTSGLDPLMQKVFIDLVLEEKARGTTFLMSSHSFAEIERTCDRAAIIKQGRIVAVKDIHELQSMQRKIFEVTFVNEADAHAFAAARGDEAEIRKGHTVRVAVQGDYNAFLASILPYPVRNIDVFAQNLEDIFMNYYDQSEVLA
ncbi:ABC-2 type transport system ATP-binding protein [Paenibacillus phyllosphaerae]|uniref:ABC-2 type transport system ATP-binding protein n=1 Tax=Paenibacillus phyllosphaerae TaxID=274593 RepID=A0A7W5B104_9BACL|nr:ABC transporter ATP-binding protein [Paenibacillus phyllosphaerae]MBB3111916.1 ABC-2 type transport system ATP-binding protein [Paenibacillus phyllosphaerae]